MKTITVNTRQAHKLNKSINDRAAQIKAHMLEVERLTKLIESC